MSFRMSKKEIKNNVEVYDVEVIDRPWTFLTVNKFF